MLARLLKAHEAWFDVTAPYEYAGRAFAGYAEFHSHGAQYVLVKRAKLWEVESHEYLFFSVVETLDRATLADAVAFMKERGIQKVSPDANHMSSALSLVFIADAVSPDAERELARTRYRKNFKFGLQGWSDLRLAAIEAASGRVVTNPAGREMKRSLEANAQTSA